MGQYGETDFFKVAINPDGSVGVFVGREFNEAFPDFAFTEEEQELLAQVIDKVGERLVKDINSGKAKTPFSKPKSDSLN